MVDRRKVFLVTLVWLGIIASLGCTRLQGGDFLISGENIQPSEQLDRSLFTEQVIAFCNRSGVQDKLGYFRTDVVVTNGQDFTTISLPEMSPNRMKSLGCFSINGGPIWTGDYAMDWGKNSGLLALAGGFDIVFTDLMYVEILAQPEQNYTLEVDRQPRELFFLDPSFINGESDQNRYLIIAMNALGNKYQNVWIYYPNRNGRSAKVTSNSVIGLPYASASFSPSEKYLIVYGSDEYPGFEIYDVEDDTNIQLSRSFFFTDHTDLSDWPFSRLFSLGPTGIKEILKDGSIPVWLNDHQVVFLAPTQNDELLPYIYEISTETFNALDNDLTGVNGLFSLNPGRTILAFVHYTSWSQTKKAAIVVYDLTSKEFRTIATLSTNRDSDLYITGLDWSPDGRFLTFSSNHTGDSEVYIANSDGSAWLNLTQHLTGESLYPIWR